MKRALLALVLAAVVLLGGYGAYVYLYQGELNVAVHDSAGNWMHVDVTFTMVWVHESGKAADVGWDNVTLTQRTIDLASYVNISALLASARIGPGMYEQIRIVVIAATGQTTAGDDVVFSVPSGDVKTTTPFVIRSGSTTTLSVDIDLTKSITCPGGNLLSCTFTPVLGQIVST